MHSTNTSLKIYGFSWASEGMQTPSCGKVALLVTFVAGLVLLGLGAARLLGPLASPGFISSCAVGSGLMAFSLGTLIYLALSRAKVKGEMQEKKTLKQVGPFRTFLAKNSTEESISTNLREIPAEFFQEKSQQRAKEIFTQAMRQVLNAEVDFQRSGNLENPEELKEKVDTSIFWVATSEGVQIDIPGSSKDNSSLHLYQVASQYNGSEAIYNYTPEVGKAMESSEADHTQGPLAQRTNPVAFELINAFLANLGFNMLEKVLPSAGKTYETGPIGHGYLIPTSENLPTLTAEFKRNFAHAEYVVYESFPESWDGKHPVFLLLQAAPAISYSLLAEGASDELEKYAALANYLAFFRYGISLSRRWLKPVLLHAAAVGCGSFRNQVKNVCWGFEKAALACQKEMKDAGVKVQLEAFQGKGPMLEMATSLQIPRGIHL